MAQQAQKEGITYKQVETEEFRTCVVIPHTKKINQAWKQQDGQLEASCVENLGARLGMAWFSSAVTVKGVDSGVRVVDLTGPSGGESKLAVKLGMTALATVFDTCVDDCKFKMIISSADQLKAVVVELAALSQANGVDIMWLR